MEENKHFIINTEAVPPSQPITRGRIIGAFRTIFLAAFAVVLPLVPLSIALVALIATKEVPPNPPSDIFTVPSQDDPSVFFVKISAPTFLTIASWSSSAAQAVAGLAVMLVSFPVARRIKNASLHHQTHELPTPFQLSLILGFLQGGGFGAIWNWMKYQFGWQGKREKITGPLKSSVQVTMAVLFLGLCIVLADTWLHVTTTMVEYVQIMPFDSARPLFSMALPPSCYNTNSSFATGCILNNAATKVFLIGADEAQKTLSNVSAEHSVISVFGSSAPSVFLGPAGIPDLAVHADFEASTIAISTQCTPASQECNLNAAYGASTPFNCYSGSFQGDVTYDTWYMEFFTDSSRSINASTQAPNSNPFYWNAANLNPDTSNALLQGDPEIVTPVHGGIAWVMACTSTAYLATYQYTNQSLFFYELTQANTSVADVLIAPLAYTTIGRWAMQQAAINAGLTNTAQDIADLLALSYSQIAMSVVAGVMQPQPASRLQTRGSQLVARIPKAPLFMLLGSNLAFAVMGIVLAGVAIGCLRGSAGNELCDVQARLSDAGVVAAAFETEKEGVRRVEELFDERSGDGRRRVGMVDGLAGWRFALWGVGTY